MKRWLFVCALIAQVGALVTVDHVLATTPTPASGTGFAARSTLEYKWKAGSEPPAWLRGAINAAANGAGAESGAATPTFIYRSDGPSTVSYTDNIPTSYAVGYATSNVPNSFAIRLRPQGYVLDWGTLTWCQFYENPPTGCYDAEMIMVHEFGHILTLDHVDEANVTAWVDTVMHVAPKTKAKAGWNAHEFGRCDVARLQLRYELKSASTPVSDCLSLGTDLSLSANKSSPAAYGTTVTLSATLTIADGPGQGNLAGDPLAGRTVWLQRRQIGASRWNDYLQLISESSSSGRYSRAFSATAPYEYRARFASPSAEGVSGSTSPALRIDIAERCVNAGTRRSSINVPIC